MITEDYVSFEVAKLLKEKGFDEATNRYYNAQCRQIRTVSDTFMWHWNNEEFMKRVLMEGAIAIPTLQMAMKWLREVHNYSISICLDSYVEPYDNEYYILIRRKKDRFEEISPCEQVYFKTYEEAAEAAIKYCLEELI